MKATALLFLFHLAGGPPGGIVFGDVPAGPTVIVFSLGALLAIGIVIAIIVAVVGFIIRKIKKANSVTEEKANPNQ